jgi:hypothetical protein
MSGGGGQQTTYTQQQSKSSSEPPAYLQPYLKEGVANLAGLYNASEQKAPAYYPGSTVAPLSQATNSAIQGTINRAQNGSPLTQGAQSQALATINGQYLDPSSNPYFSGAVDAALKPQTEQFMNQIIPGITSAFEGSGRTGSGLHQAAVDQAVTNLTRSQADARTKAYSDQYNTARGQQIDAVNNAGNYANWDYNDLGMLAQAGGAQDTYSQRQTDADVARYNYNQNKDWNYLARYLGMLNGAYPGGETSGSSFGSSMAPAQQSSPLGAIFGGAGLGLQAISMFSDARLKEDIAPVGKTFDGQNLYSYRYKGDPRTQIGLMAQEVAETKPEAVSVHPSGYMMVDYAKATAPRGFI